MKETEMWKTIQKINKYRNWFFERISNIDMPLVRLIKGRERQKIQINRIRHDKGDITTNPTEIQKQKNKTKTQRLLWTSVYAHKLENLKEMDKWDKCLERYDLPRLNQEEVESLNRQIMSSKIESVIKSLPITKIPGPDRFTAKLLNV